MHGHALRFKLFYNLHGMGHILRRFPRQAHNQVHVDIVKSHLPGQMVLFQNLTDRMPSPDKIQGLLLHRLGIDGDAGDAVIPQHLQFLRRYAVGASRFDRKLLHGIHGEPALYSADQPVQILRGEGRRGAAADVDGLQHFPLHLLRDIIHLPEHGVKVLSRPSLPGSDGEGGEGAVEAGGRAEGNSRIEAVAVHRVCSRKKFLLPLCHLHAEVPLLLSRVVGFLHIIPDGLRGFPGKQLRQGNLGGPDAGEISPGKIPSRIVPEHPVKAALDLILCPAPVGKVGGKCLRKRLFVPVFFHPKPQLIPVFFPRHLRKPCDTESFRCVLLPVREGLTGKIGHQKLTNILFKGSIVQ